MADITGASLGSIKNRLSGAATYHPMEAETFSDWATEAGDVVTVKRGNESYNSPVYSSKLVWKGAPQMTLSSTGNKERESLQKVSSKKYRKNGAALRNSQRLQQHLQDAYGNLKSYFEVTESRMYAEFKGKYDGLSSHFEVTRSRMAADFQGKYDGLSSHFEVTRSQMAADFQGKYDGLSSYFEVTRSQMAADFQGKYDGLSSHFEVTRSQMAADFQGKYDGLSSHFEVTRSNFNVSVSNYYNQLSSGISVTSSTLTNYVNGKTSRASLLLTINGSGKSNAKLEADVINIDGNDSVTLSDVLTIDTSENDSIVRIKTTKLRVGTSATNLVTLTDGIFTATEYHYKDLVNKTVEPMLMKASVDGNTLKIWKFGDAANAPSVTFSKATTLNPTWSSGNFPLTINMQQTNDGVTTNVGTPKTIGFTNANDIYLEINKNGSVSAFGSSKKVINVPYKITQKLTVNGQNQDSIRYTGSIAAVDATSVYNNGFNDVTLTGPTWNTNPNSDNTTASNSVTVSADNKTDGTTRTKNIPIGLYVDSTNLQAYVSAGGHKRAVASLSNIYGDGWTAARNKLNIPIQTVTNSNSYTVYYPSATVGERESRTYILSNNGNNTVDMETLVNGSYVTVARQTHNKYNAGWAASRSRLSIPIQTVTNSTSYTIQYPSETVDAASESRTFMLSSDDDNYVDLTTSVNGSYVTVARLVHHKYDYGWDNAVRRLNIPIQTVTNNNAYTFYYPSDVTRYSTSSRTLILSSNNNNYVDLETLVNGSYVTVARLVHHKYDYGWDNAVGRLNIPLQQVTNDNGYLIHYPSTSTRYSTESRSFIMSSSDNNHVDLETYVGNDYIPVARLSHGKYNAGWAAARDKLNIPLQEKTDDYRYVIKYPPTTVDGNAESRTYFLQKFTDYVALRTMVNGAYRTLAKIDI